MYKVGRYINRRLSFLPLRLLFHRRSGTTLCRPFASHSRKGSGLTGKSIATLIPPKDASASNLDSQRCAFLYVLASSVTVFNARALTWFLLQIATGVACLLTTSTVNAVNHIEVRGQDFVDSVTNDRFVIVGIDYQPGGQG